MRSDLELSRIEAEHLRNALETMRTEYEGREMAVRVCSCRFVLEMVGYCKVLKVCVATLFSLRVCYLRQLCNFIASFGGLLLLFEGGGVEGVVTFGTLQ